MIYIHNQTLRIRYTLYKNHLQIQNPIQIFYNVSGESGYACKSLIYIVYILYTTYMRASKIRLIIRMGMTKPRAEPIT